MKQLPVIQNPTQTAGPQSGELQTEGMIAAAARAAALRPLVVAALSKVLDPEIPVNIYELGLIYDIIIDQAGRVGIRMTLTAPACPAAQYLPVEVQRQVAQIP